MFRIKQLGIDDDLFGVAIGPEGIAFVIGLDRFFNQPFFASFAVKPWCRASLPQFQMDHPSLGASVTLGERNNFRLQAGVPVYCKGRTE